MPKKDQFPWDTKKLAFSRARREGASAPRERDLKIYEKFFRQSIKNKKNPRVLILGMTPELNEYRFNKLNSRLEKFLRDGKVQLNKNDKWKVENVIKHTGLVIHSALPEQVFEKMISRYFKIIDRKASTKIPGVEWPLIYYFKNK
ncbi:hypothetical protein COT99_00590 [Candidatus Falkowbacteria bacterium CG10_big_fil_rev_8_21_14_0_10_43_10]|uniref:Uncharacterized protein n=1 Tax=Candidatus Falkowbacteria bacterium CG10_big_fil_rev_8_21_14_0_10_43_10 TaxID=1974567 RepID=A0A2H0V2Z0_9BACT|nr:MAG: hypothetical protein COT99_00590 [Candidatus Falkowbacteria bacterium CG10_big_fil_rev_8_21_14_0_10_43_10]